MRIWLLREISCIGTFTFVLLIKYIGKDSFDIQIRNCALSLIFIANAKSENKN